MILFQLLQAGALPTPIFSNDLPGFFKLLLLAGGIVGAVATLVVKLVYSSTAKRQDDMQRDMDGLGKRLNEEAASRGECTASVSSLTDRMTRHESVVNNVVAGHAELKATVNAMASQSAEQQRDVMAAILATGQQFNSAFTDLRVDVAKLSERNRVGDTLAEGLSEIAKIMRENRRTNP